VVRQQRYLRAPVIKSSIKELRVELVNSTVLLYYTHKEIDSNSNAGNACHSVENLLSSQSLSRNIKIETHRTVILPVVLYGVKRGLSQRRKATA
jgi:hypothetical protein